MYRLLVFSVVHLVLSPFSPCQCLRHRKNGRKRRTKNHRKACKQIQCTGCCLNRDSVFCKTLQPKMPTAEALLIFGQDQVGPHRTRDFSRARIAWIVLQTGVPPLLLKKALSEALATLHSSKQAGWDHGYAFFNRHLLSSQSQLLNFSANGKVSFHSEEFDFYKVKSLVIPFAQRFFSFTRFKCLTLHL